MTKFLKRLCYTNFGDNNGKSRNDEEHEKDLQKRINDFIKGIDEEDLIDIKYQIHAFLAASSEQIYCYSAMIIFRVS